MCWPGAVPAWLAALVLAAPAVATAAVAPDRPGAATGSGVATAQPVARGKASSGPARHAKVKVHAVRGDDEPDAFVYGRRDDVLRFAAETATQHGLDAVWVESTLAQARFNPAVARLIMPPPPGSAKNWAAYRERFVEPERIRAGVAFWHAHQAWLDAAQQRYGVPPGIVVGIIGVETFFGRVTGGFRVLDALATLSFDFPAGRKDRSGFFRDELARFLVLARRDALDPAAVTGSYAGAIGLGQFMPGSILDRAVDFDGDGRIDMQASPADVIGSIAHYLAEAGWQADVPTRLGIRPPVDSADRAALLVPDVVPTFSVAQMAERGAVLDDAGVRFAGPLALVELQNGDAAPSYIAGTRNFYALTRYNNSSYYALAVIELGQVIDAVRRATP